MFGVSLFMCFQCTESNTQKHRLPSGLYISQNYKKMGFYAKDFFSKCEKIHNEQRIWSHILKKSLMEDFTFCAVNMHYTQKNAD